MGTLIKFNFNHAITLLLANVKCKKIDLVSELYCFYLRFVLHIILCVCYSCCCCCINFQTDMLQKQKEALNQ